MNLVLKPAGLVFTFLDVAKMLSAMQVWMMLEEKQIPYRVVKVNMRSYGEKPASFLSKGD